MQSLNIVHRLTIPASFLDIILHYRYGHRALYYTTFNQPGGISQGAAFAKDNGCCVLCASHTCHKRCYHSIGMVVPYHTSQQSRVQTLATHNHHASTSLFERMHSLYSIHGPVLQVFGRQCTEIILGEE